MGGQTHHRVTCARITSGELLSNEAVMVQIIHYRDHQRAVDRWSNMERVKLVERETGAAVCMTCDGCGVVCENHQGKPWAGESSRRDACDCGAGAPCEACGGKNFPFFRLADTAPSEYCAPDALRVQEVESVDRS